MANRPSDGEGRRESRRGLGILRVHKKSDVIFIAEAHLSSPRSPSPHMVSTTSNSIRLMMEQRQIGHRMEKQKPPQPWHPPSATKNSDVAAIDLLLLSPIVIVNTATARVYKQASDRICSEGHHRHFVRAPGRRSVQPSQGRSRRTRGDSPSLQDLRSYTPWGGSLSPKCVILLQIRMIIVVSYHGSMTIATIKRIDTAAR